MPAPLLERSKMDSIVVALAALIFSGVASAGVVITIVRNGKSNTRKDAELKTELKVEIGHVKEKLDNPESGLSAISSRQSAMTAHCAGMTGRFEERIKNLEKKKKR